MNGTDHHASNERRWPGRLVKILVVLLAVLLLIQLIASPIAKDVVNRKLAALPGYTGHAGAVRLSLWRGGAAIHDLVLAERGHENEPLLKVDGVSLTFSWAALVRGKIGGRLSIDRADVLVVKTEATPPEAKDKDEKKRQQQEKLAQVRKWQAQLEEAFPMELTRFEIRDSRVRFIDRSHDPAAEIGIEQLNVAATHLKNRPDANDELPAKLDVTGLMTGHGRLKAHAEADPLQKSPRFNANFEVVDLSLPELNNFMRAYANADVSKGTFEVYMEVTAQGGSYHGYVKPFFKDLDFKNESDKDKNAAQKLAEKAMSAVTTAFKNDAEQKVATKVPFEGDFANNDVAVWTTIENLMRNAFVQALREGLEGQTPER